MVPGYTIPHQYEVGYQKELVYTLDKKTHGPRLQKPSRALTPYSCTAWQIPVCAWTNPRNPQCSGHPFCPLSILTSPQPLFLNMSTSQDQDGQAPHDFSVVVDSAVSLTLGSDSLVINGMTSQPMQVHIDC